MGKLQIIVLIIVIASCFIHIRNQRNDKTYFKHLLFGLPDKKGRILYLDYIRLIATLSVILLHCVDTYYAGLPTGSSAYAAVQSISDILLVCNTLFVMASGALQLNGRTKHLKNFYYKRILQVAIPFFCYYCIYILLSCQYFNAGFFHGVYTAVKDMVKGAIGWAPHLWIIYIILSLYILAPFFNILMEQLDETMLHGMAIIILIFLCTDVYLPSLGFTINFNLMISPWLGIFLLGYYFAHPISMKYRKWYFLLGIVSFFFTILINGWFSNYQSMLTTSGAPTLVIISGSVFLLLRTCEDRLPKPGFVLKFLIRHSYSILLVHWALLYFVKERLEITAHTFGMAGGACLSFILILFLSIVASFVFDQTVVLCAQSLFKALFYSSDS